MKWPFQRIPESEEDADEKLLESGTDEEKDFHRAAKLSISRNISAIIAAASIAIAAFLLGLLLGQAQKQARLSSLCLDYTSRPSPLTRDLSISFSTLQFNGSLLKENVYRNQANPEMDAAWEALNVEYRPLVVPKDDAVRVGLAEDQVKVNSRHGGGYLANVEGLHQLHCLNLVRQTLYYNYEYYHSKGKGAFKNDEYIVQKHVSHCLDIIRQQLMCTIDIGVLGQVWFQPEGSKFPERYVDFNTRHVCRNFDDIRLWAGNHQIPEDVPQDFLEPPKRGDRVYSVIPWVALNIASTQSTASS